MDGGSTDETSTIVREYASRLVFISKPDRGQSHAINEGFRLAKGSVLAWINSDDVFLPGAVSAAVRALNCDPEAGLVYGDGYVIDALGDITGPFPHTREPDLWRLVYLSDYILQQSVFFRREVLDDVGYLDEALHYGLDWDLFIRIGLKYRLVYLPKYLGCLREYPETKSSSGGIKRIRELHAILRKHTGLSLPPGSTVYGLDTYADLACREIRLRTPPRARSLGNLLEQAVRFVAGHVIHHTLQHAQGLYPDGWAGVRLQYMFPSGCRSVLMEGSVPDWLHGQSLQVECNARRLGKYDFAAGKFKLEIAIPSDLTGEPIHLRIVARRWFLTSFFPWRADCRRLAYKVDCVRGLEFRGDQPPLSSNPPRPLSRETSEKSLP
jgi:hypothetical protein